MKQSHLFFRSKWNGSQSYILTITVLIQINRCLSQHLKTDVRALYLLEYFFPSSHLFFLSSECISLMVLYCVGLAKLSCFPEFPSLCSSGRGLEGRETCMRLGRPRGCISLHLALDITAAFVHSCDLLALLVGVGNQPVQPGIPLQRFQVLGSAHCLGSAEKGILFFKFFLLRYH